MQGKVGFSMRLAPPPKDVGSNQGLEATYTERGSTTIERPGNRSNQGLEATYTQHDFTMSERGLENCCAGNRTEGLKPPPGSATARLAAEPTPPFRTDGFGR